MNTLYRVAGLSLLLPILYLVFYANAAVGQTSEAGITAVGQTSEAGTTAVGQTSEAGTTAVSQEMDLSQVVALLKQQQQEMANQRRLLETQSGEINRLRHQLVSLQGPKAPTSQARAKVSEAAEMDRPPTEKKTKQELKTETETRVTVAQTDDPTQSLLTNFRGAWRLPGTDAAFRIGGYVKTTGVYNSDPLESKDRFIVGKISVNGDSDSESNSNSDSNNSDNDPNNLAQSSITASQSRLNFDMREQTDHGVLRAFLEGDFAANGDTFRLRHAFGQWRQILAGKTWSTFVDTDASPEEVDFEGLNGRINVRQSQVRYMPTLGDNYKFKVSLEDPNPRVENGNGVTRFPDLVASATFQPRPLLHLRVAAIARQIRAQRQLAVGGGEVKDHGWGISLSGRLSTPELNERDSLLFQLNGGTGIGRYVNDLSSVGSFDGIINPETGKLALFHVLAGYVSWQHWWRGDMRSNFTLGIVDVDNPEFVDADAYKRTVRVSSNVIWSPVPRINIGLEYLWGSRENEDGEDGDAQQVQISAQYSF
jgi:hypothetical protein